MLLQFSTSNFRSIKDEVTLSMVANSEVKEHEDWLCRAGSENLLSVAAIYGANAAGKSNILNAMAVAIKLIRYSDLRGINNTLPEIAPFLFDEEMHTQPTRFDFIFVYKGKKYQYGFAANRRMIIEEYLYVYEASKPTKIFERQDMNQYSFPAGKEKRFNEYAEKIRPINYSLQRRHHGIVRKRKSPICGLRRRLMYMILSKSARKDSAL